MGGVVLGMGWRMQRAKDTFYAVLRDGVSGVNPQRTAVVRGVLRPGVLVEENELPAAVPPPDVFRLRWTVASVDTRGTVPLAKLRCEIAYETAGTEAVGGMDRGRLLEAMDAELTSVLEGEMQSAAKMDYSSGTAVPEGTRIFWSEILWGATEVKGERLARAAAVEVWSLEASS